MLSFPRCLLAGIALTALPLPVLACSGSLHIELSDSGVYALDQAAVVAQQPALIDCPRDSFVLTQAGKEVPIRISGSGTILAAGDRIEWIGQPLHGPQSWYDAYSTVNVYQLSSRPGTHMRFSDVPPPSGEGSAKLQRRLHLEQENLMIRLNQTLVKLWDEPDYWHWAKLTHVDPAPFEFSFDLPDLADRAGSVSMDLVLRGMSTAPGNGKDPKPTDHNLNVQLNDRAVTRLAWDDRNEVTKHVDLPITALRESGNRISLSVPKRELSWNKGNPVVDVIMFNSAELDYPIRGNLDKDRDPIHSSGNTVLLTRTGSAPWLYSDDGRRYEAASAGASQWRYAASTPDAILYPLLDDAVLTPSLVRAQHDVDWNDPKQAWDYLIISHPRLIEAVKPLAEFHRQRGLKVALIDVNDVYDSFNHGIIHPVAIRNLLQQAHQHWPEPRPRFALLVGDASFDIRHARIDRLALAKWADRELLEPGHFGDIPSTPYADQPSDLPHRNLIPTWQYPSYDGQSASDNHFASVSDDPLHPVIAVGRLPVVQPAEVDAIVAKTIAYMKTPELGEWRRDVMFITDESDYFKNTSDEVAASLDSEGFAADKVYASKEEADNLAHQSAIKDGLNQGRLLVHFIGHGGRYIWRTGPPDLRKNHDLFTLDDVSGLNNGARLPMILSMTCYSAPFDNPTEDSIGERFLREADKGAIAVFAASWRNSPSPQYSKAIIEQLTKPGQTIGEAIVAGKATNNDPTLVETYNLLGDPALILERPQGDLKLIRRGTPFGGERIDVQLARAPFSGMIAADWIDDKGKILHSMKFSAMGSRFVIPDPPLGIASKASELRAYAADPQSGFDAIGRLVLRDPIVATAPATAGTNTGPVPDKINNDEAKEKQDEPATTSQPVGRLDSSRPDAMMGDGFDQSLSTRESAAAALAEAAPVHNSRNALRK